jgi:O-antigen ligase
MNRYLKIQNVLLYLFFFTLNFEVWDPLNTGGFFSIAKLTGFLYAISLVPKIQMFLKIPKVFKPYVRLISFFYVFLVCISLININIYSTDFLQLSILQNLVLFVFLLNHELLNPGVLEKSFIYFFLGSMVLALCFYLGIGLGISDDGRISLFGDNENIIGVRMVISTLILTHILLKYRNVMSKFTFLLLPLFYIPLISLTLNTGSRLSFISLFLGIAVTIVLYKNRSVFNKIFILLSGLIASIFLFNLAMETEVLGARLTKTANEGNLAGRDDIWLSILPLIENNWIIGVGNTGYVEYVSRIYGKIISPHNVIIEVLAYSGIIGLSLFLNFIGSTFLLAFKYFRKYNEVIPFVFIVPISGIILSAQILTFKLGWVIFAFAVSRSTYIKMNNIQ